MTVTTSYDYSAIKRKDTSASPTAVYVNGTQCYRMKVNGTDVIHKTVTYNGITVYMMIGVLINHSYTESEHSDCNSSWTDRTWSVTAASISVYFYMKSSDVKSGGAVSGTFSKTSASARTTDGTVTVTGYLPFILTQNGSESNIYGTLLMSGDLADGAPSFEISSDSSSVTYSKGVTLSKTFETEDDNIYFRLDLGCSASLLPSVSGAGTLTSQTAGAIAYDQSHYITAASSSSSVSSRILSTAASGTCIYKEY